MLQDTVAAVLDFLVTFVVVFQDVVAAVDFLLIVFVVVFHSAVASALDYLIDAFSRRISRRSVVHAI